MSSPLPLDRCQLHLNAWAQERFNLSEPLGGRWRVAFSQPRLNGRARRVFDSDAWGFSALLIEGAKPEAGLWRPELDEPEREAALVESWRSIPAGPPILQALQKGQIQDALALVASGRPSPLDLSRALFEACQRGSVDAIEALAPLCPLDTPQSDFPNPAPYESDSDLFTDCLTPLALAIFNGRSDIAEILLNAGASPFGPGPLWSEPAAHASSTGDPALMALVFEACARVDLASDPNAWRYRSLARRVGSLSNFISRLAPALFEASLSIALVKKEALCLEIETRSRVGGSALAARRRL